MSSILLIETATKVCSVGFAENEILLAIRESHSANSHSSVITSFTNDVIRAATKKKSDINAVCISMGPGSYTGLRIGVSTAKGLCYAWDKPLISVNTLQSMALLFAAEHPEHSNPATLFCPMIDARRMEVFTALFDNKGTFIRNTSAEIITEDSFSDMLAKHKIIFFGDGSEKCRTILSKHTNALFESGFSNSVKGMLLPAFEKLRLQQFEDTAYFEPYYLKDFLATVPKKLL